METWREPSGRFAEYLELRGCVYKDREDVSIKKDPSLPSKDGDEDVDLSDDDRRI